MSLTHKFEALLDQCLQPALKDSAQPITLIQAVSQTANILNATTEKHGYHFVVLQGEHGESSSVELFDRKNITIGTITAGETQATGTKIHGQKISKLALCETFQLLEDSGTRLNSIQMELVEALPFPVKRQLRVGLQRTIREREEEALAEEISAKVRQSPELHLVT